MNDNIIRFENKAMNEIPEIEKQAQKLLDDNKKDEATTTLNRYTADFEASTRQAWREMEETFWHMFRLGF